MYEAIYKQTVEPGNTTLFIESINTTYTAMISKIEDYVLGIRFALKVE